MLLACITQNDRAYFLVKVNEVQLIEDGIYQDASVATVFGSNKCPTGIKVCVTVDAGELVKDHSIFFSFNVFSYNVNAWLLYCQLLQMSIVGRSSDGHYALNEHMKRRIYIEFFSKCILAKKNISVTSNHPGPLFKLVFKYNAAGSTGRAANEAIFYFNSADGKIMAVVPEEQRFQN